MQTDSTSYSLRSFGGMPLTLQRMFHKINQHNINTTFGQEFQIQNPAGLEEEKELFQS
jgi:hypothetical protein